MCVFGGSPELLEAQLAGAVVVDGIEGGVEADLAAGYFDPEHLAERAEGPDARERAEIMKRER